MGTATIFDLGSHIGTGPLKLKFSHSTVLRSEELVLQLPQTFLLFNRLHLSG